MNWVYLRLDVDLGFIWVDSDSLVAVENSADDEDGSDEERGLEKALVVWTLHNAHISPESGGGLSEVVTESDGSSDNGSGELGKHSRTNRMKKLLILNFYRGRVRLGSFERIKYGLVWLLRATSVRNWKFVWVSNFHELFYPQISRSMCRCHLFHFFLLTVNRAFVSCATSDLRRF